MTACTTYHHVDKQNFKANQRLPGQLHNRKPHSFIATVPLCTMTTLRIICSLAFLLTTAASDSPLDSSRPGLLFAPRLVLKQPTNCPMLAVERCSPASDDDVDEEEEAAKDAALAQQKPVPSGKGGGQ